MKTSQTCKAPKEESKYGSLKNVKKCEKSLENFIECIKELVECPITMIPMQNPCITLSGHTVEGGIMKQWIGKFIHFHILENKKKDPWDRTECKFQIRNLMAVEIASLLESFGLNETTSSN